MRTAMTRETRISIIALVLGGFDTEGGITRMVVLLYSVMRDQGGRICMLVRSTRARFGPMWFVSFHFLNDNSWDGRIRRSRSVRMEQGALSAALVRSVCMSGKGLKKGSYLGICKEPLSLPS